MNKTISVNIHGLNFLIEEDAHTRLSGYLEDINKHFGKGANVQEVTSDIEASIAEKLQSTLTPFKNVITLADIEDLIGVMGTAKDFDEVIGEDAPAHEEPRPETSNQIKRRLYRDSDNAVIAGVAAGLGAYFDIDPVIFRVLFVIFTIFGGFAIPLYIVLWIVMPEAKTLNQKLEMHGQAPTLDALERMAQQKGSPKDQSAFHKVISVPFVVLSALFGALQRLCRRIAPVVRVLLGAIFILAALAFLGCIGTGAVYALLNVDSPYKLSYIPIAELTHAIPLAWLVLTGFFSLAVPAFFLLFGGITLIFRRTIVNLTVASIVVGLWMISGITCCALGLRYLPDLVAKVQTYPALQTEKRQLEAQGITQVSASGPQIRLVLNSGTSTEATISGRRIDLDQVDIKTDGQHLTITQKPRTGDQRYCIGCGTEPVTLTLDAGALKGIETDNRARATINGNLKGNPKISADNESDIVWKNLQAQQVTATLGQRTTLILDGQASIVTTSLDDARLLASSVGAQTFDITAKGQSTAILGPSAKLTVDADAESRILYAGKPALVEKQTAGKLAPYRILNSEEFDALNDSERSAEAEGKTPTSTAISNGAEYFLLERNQLSEHEFRAFQSALRDSEN